MLSQGLAGLCTLFLLSPHNVAPVATYSFYHHTRLIAVSLALLLCHCIAVSLSAHVVIYCIIMYRFVAISQYMYDTLHQRLRTTALPCSSHLCKLCPLNMAYSNSSSPLSIDCATGMAEVTLTSDESRALVAMLGQTRELTPTLSSLLVRLQGVLSPPTSMPIIPEAGMSYSVQVSRNRWDNLFLDESIYEVTSRGSLVQDSAGGVNVNAVPKPAKGTKSSGSSRPKELASKSTHLLPVLRIR